MQLINVNSSLHFLDKIVGVDVSVLGSYVPFTYLFAVTLHYKTGTEVDSYSPTHYSWCFSGILHHSGVVVNTTSPLLNHTFEVADSYTYHLWVSNAVSNGYARGKVTGIVAMILLTHDGVAMITTLLNVFRSSFSTLIVDYKVVLK